MGTTLGTPSYSLTSTTPDYREDLISLKLYDQANTLLATGAGATTRAVGEPDARRLQALRLGLGRFVGSDHYGVLPGGQLVARDHL